MTARIADAIVDLLRARWDIIIPSKRAGAAAAAAAVEKEEEEEEGVLWSQLVVLLAVSPVVDSRCDAYLVYSAPWHVLCAQRYAEEYVVGVWLQRASLAVVCI